MRLRTLCERLRQTPNASALKDDTDFFLMGIDSLMVTRVRSVISKTLNAGGKTLGFNVVFEKPSIKQLSRFLFKLGVLARQARRKRPRKNHEKVD